MAVQRRSAVNRLVHRLPPAEAALIGPWLQDVPLEAGDLLCEAGGPIRHAVFPLTGIVSLSARTAEGSVLELGIVGRDGMLGAALTSGIAASPLRAMVQGSGRALRIDAGRFRRAVADCPTLRARAHRFGHRLTEQIAQTAVCNSFHSVKSRSARWMLAISDRMDCDEFALTQSLLAVMLGVLRPTVSLAASALASEGLVAYRRGEVQILDRAGLEAAACSCYPIVAGQYRAALR